MREIVHIQAGQCGNQIGAKVSEIYWKSGMKVTHEKWTIWPENRDEKNFAESEERTRKQ